MVGLTRTVVSVRWWFSELRDTNNLEWTLKMTNLTEDGEYLLAKNQSEHQQPSELKPYKKQYLADREKKYFEKNEIGKFDFRSKYDNFRSKNNV